jgi:hypothetical protein
MRALALAAFVLGSVGLAGATAAQGKADPTGTWKWETMFKDQKREQTVKLKLEGTKLTGTMPGRKDGQETKIEDGKFKDGEVSFTVTRERGGEKFVTKYKGKLEGDTIKGTIESSFGGKDQKRDWEAKRVKDDK